MKHLVITPAHNEAGYIENILKSMVGQSLKAHLWIIVNDGSTDNTADIVKSYASNHQWIKLIQLDTSAHPRMGGSKVVNAFNMGFEAAGTTEFDFVTKLDADLTLPPDYFEKIESAFLSDPKLGICGGYIVNMFKDGSQAVERSAGYHVRGALKTVRKACWHDIGGFKSCWHWDGLDIMEARYHGWDTRSIDLRVLHHRPTSSAYDPLTHAYKSGYESYKIGSDYPLTLIRASFKFFQKPFGRLSIQYVRGFMAARAKKEPKIVTTHLAAYIRKFHYKRIIGVVR